MRGRVVKWGVRLLAALVATPVTVVVVALPAIVGYHFHYDHLQARVDAQIALGMSEAEVVALAGTPLAVTSRSVDPEGYPRSDLPACTREFWYAPRYTFIPSRWSYCFDAEDRLIDKYHWVSW